MVGEGMVYRLATERLEESFIFGLCEWCRHTIGSIQPGKRSNAVDARVLAVGETFPTQGLQVAELGIAPGLHVFGDNLRIVGSAKLLPLLAVRRNDTNAAIVKVDAVLLVNQSHVIRAMGVFVGCNQVQVF